MSYHFLVSFNLKVILFVAKITQNTMTALKCQLSPQTSERFADLTSQNSVKKRVINFWYLEFLPNSQLSRHELTKLTMFLADHESKLLEAFSCTKKPL